MSYGNEYKKTEEAIKLFLEAYPSHVNLSRKAFIMFFYKWIGCDTIEDIMSSKYCPTNIDRTFRRMKQENKIKTDIEHLTQKKEKEVNEFFGGAR